MDGNISVSALPIISYNSPKVGKKYEYESNPHHQETSRDADTWLQPERQVKDKQL